MANQGNKGNERDRDREGNLGQSGNDMNNPAGTSGRQENENWGGNDPNRQSGEVPRRKTLDDDDSPLGNRNTTR